MRTHLIIFVLLILATSVAEARKTVIPIETEHTQLLLAVRDNGVLETLHFGAKVADPEAFLAFDTGRGEDNGDGPMAYPTAGGRFLGQPALHAKYADGTHNTELFYVSHLSRPAGGAVTTEVLLKDPVSLLEVKLVFVAC